MSSCEIFVILPGNMTCRRRIQAYPALIGTRPATPDRTERRQRKERGRSGTSEWMPVRCNTCSSECV
ncbi:hypothetical protein L596_019974 [Steinernema carpocapsae]|uniref:Uncharacterized protein n=1 Tax=Steinernema carpocapsae TaxID=34508 RepID=A0A4U5MSR3_STECR|nr:hypothetical protein L596_019974 [Steinernema carpocapsae]